MVEIRVNGSTRQVAAGKTLAGLLEELDLDPRWVIAELNGRPVPRDEYARAPLHAGDRLELVRPVAGG
jgi:thiamine biosynthesis protein ThiS